MKQYWTRLNDWLAQLEPRERLFVLGGAVALLVMFLYAGVWDPLARAHRSREQSLDGARSIASKLEIAGAALQGARRGGGTNTQVSLISAIAQTSKSPVLGKEPTRTQPDGDKSVALWIDDVPFDNLMRWLNDLEQRFGIVPIAADVQRQSGAGLVNAHLTLARP
jgi:general secretion pathway protein M